MSHGLQRVECHHEKRVSSSALIKNSPVKPATCQAEQTKKPGNNDLLDGIEQNLRFISSAAIAIDIAYLKSQDTLKDSDDNHVGFATYALDKLQLLYKKANGDDKSKFHGLYQGAFVVQMFGTHFTAINGARKVHGLEKPGEHLNPAGGSSTVVHCINSEKLLRREVPNCHHFCQGIFQEELLFNQDECAWLVDISESESGSKDHDDSDVEVE
ncbi:hypothetical protein DFH29DRAFT_881787 [Suillus ampliporus]|nr:hypothetical protein DFH29DRAFT_881787 [Suillus ampliporus]